MNQKARSIEIGNLLVGLPAPDAEENFLPLLDRPGLRIERIVSHGHTTPVDAPYEQTEDEWVLLLKGAARLWLDGRDEIVLSPGDHLLIPAGRRHRVTWTVPDAPTIWLAIHFPPEISVSPAPTAPPGP